MRMCSCAYVYGYQLSPKICIPHVKSEKCIRLTIHRVRRVFIDKRHYWVAHFIVFEDCKCMQIHSC